MGQLIVSSTLSLGDCFPAPSPLFFNFLIGLPEEEIGRDRRSENCNHGCEICSLKMNGRDERSLQDFTPIGLSEERGSDVGKKGERQPFKDLRNSFIG